MKLIKPILFALCFIASNNLFAQNPKAIEADLLRSFKRIDYWGEQLSSLSSNNDYTRWHDAYDPLQKANVVFGKKLKAYIQKYPATITYPFNSLVKHHLDISTSSDGLFRIYSWGSLTEDIMGYFKNVMQYKTGSGFKAVFEYQYNDSSNYKKIFTFKANGLTYYLAVYSDDHSHPEISSHVDDVEGIHIFTIEDGQLSDAELIKTETGLANDLSYTYNDLEFKAGDDYTIPTINFDKATNTIYVPLVVVEVVEDDEEKVATHKLIAYKFTGQYFEKVKN